MKEVHTAQELGKALNAGEEIIEIQGDLEKEVVKIKATGKVAFIVAAGAVAVAVIAALALVPAGAAGPEGVAIDGIFAVAAAGSAVAIWGIPVTIAAISIGVGAKNKNAIKTLYNDYKITEKKNNSIIIHSKK